MSNEGKFLKF